MCQPKISINYRRRRPRNTVIANPIPCSVVDLASCVFEPALSVVYFAFPASLRIKYSIAVSPPVVGLLANCIPRVALGEPAEEVDVHSLPPTYSGSLR